MRSLPILIVTAMTLALATQLVDLAEQTSNKTVMFAENANQALDCALAGVDIKQCSPTIMATSFNKEVENFTAIIKEFEELEEDNLVFEKGNGLVLDKEEYSIVYRVESVEDEKVTFSRLNVKPEFKAVEISVNWGDSLKIDIDDDDSNDLLLNIVDIQQGFVLTQYEELSANSFSITSFFIWIKNHK